MVVDRKLRSGCTFTSLPDFILRKKMIQLGTAKARFERANDALIKRLTIAGSIGWEENDAYVLILEGRFL